MKKPIPKLVEELILQEESQPLTLAQAAAYMGISKSHLYKMTSTNKITFYKPGKKIYFKKVDLNKYLFRNRQPSEMEIEQRAIDYVTLQA